MMLAPKEMAIMATFKLYLFVAIGGAGGAMMRFFIAQQISLWFGRGFPLATLLVNVAGSFVIGALYSLVQTEAVVAPWRIGITVGFLGALTTFSTFSLDTVLLIQQGAMLKAIVNVFSNVVVCLLAAWAGLSFFK